MITGARVNPFLTPDLDALDDHYREVLVSIIGTVNVDSMAANPRLMSDYLVLRGLGMIKLNIETTDELEGWGRLEIVLTDKAAQVAKPAPRPIHRVETGDQVTIKDLRPHIGRSGETRAYWCGFTGDPYYPVVYLYSEDWNVLKKAGYDLPGWNDRAATPYDQLDRGAIEDIAFGKHGGFAEKSKKKSKPVEAGFPCQIEVILKPEQINGHWRIASVVEPEVKWIFVNYAELSAGDHIQNGREGDYQIKSIGEVYQGTRQGVVEDANGKRDVVFKSTLTYTLVKGGLLEAARKDRGMIEWRGSGWVVKARRAG